MRPSVPLLVTLHSASLAAADPECVKGLYILVGRGTDEKKGTGALGIVANDIAKKIDDSKVVAIDYPATGIVPGYSDSVKFGANVVHNQITDYAKACPNNKIAYLGYSQGAQIGSEAICGPSNPLTLSNKVTISIETILSNVVAFATFGDPTHMVGASYDRGTSQHNGVLARHDASNCKNYGDRMAAWCDTGDVFCDSGKNDTVHGTYVQRYGNAMTDFVVEKFHDAASDKGNNSTTATGTATGTGTDTSATSAPTSDTGSGTQTTDTADGTATTTTGQPTATNAAGQLTGKPVAALAALFSLMFML